MKTEQIVMCVVALLIGMLVANMLTNVCGCKTRTEGFDFTTNDGLPATMTPGQIQGIRDATCTNANNEIITNGCTGGSIAALKDQCVSYPRGSGGLSYLGQLEVDATPYSSYCPTAAASTPFAATCGEIRDGGPAFDTCGTNKVYDDKKSSGQTLDDTNCCIDATCEKYSYSDGVYSPWPCTTGTYNSVANNATSPTDSICCTTGAGAGAGTDCTTPSFLDGPEYGTITETELNKNGFGVTLACADGYSTASPRPDSHGWADPGPPVGVPCAEDGGDYTVTNPCECVDRHDVERAASGQEPQCPTWALNGVCTHPTRIDKQGHDTGGQGWMNRNCAQSCSQCPSALGTDGDNRMDQLQEMVPPLCSTGAAASVGNCYAPLHLTDERQCATDPCQPMDYGDANSSCCKNQCDWSDENYKEAKAEGDCGCPDNTWQQCCSKAQMDAHTAGDALSNYCALCLYPDGDDGAPVQCIQP